MQNEGGLFMALTIEKAKQLICHSCGSKIAVIASDVQERTEMNGQKVSKKYYTCPECKHDNFLKSEDIPEHNVKFMEDILFLRD